MHIVLCAFNTLLETNAHICSVLKRNTKKKNKNKKYGPRDHIVSE